jgi:hypothetical protein
VRVLLIVVLVAIATPWALGPAMGELLHAFGESSHVCKCGMKAGTCGCPACARLEKQRLDDERPCPVPAMRRSCDDHSPGLAFGLLGDVRSPEITALPPIEQAQPATLPGLDRSPKQRRLDPPTPPPRIAA